MPRKLIVQVPCFNEEATLPATLAELPRRVPGFSCIEYLVIDDGSSDRTAEVARAHGAHHLVRLPRRRGLAHAFRAGLEEALRQGADVIVNTDGDNQYQGADVGALVAPILAGRAHIVIGERDIQGSPHFSRTKKVVSRVGSRVVAALSGVPVSDAPSGFRAFSRRAAQELELVDAYSHTLETIVQAGRSGVPIACVPIRVNPPTRRSRLARSTLHYVVRSAVSLVRASTQRGRPSGAPYRSRITSKA